MTLVIFLVFCAMIVFILLLTVMVLDSDTSIERNYEVRFSAHNKKYYIVNCTIRGDKRVTGRFGFTIYYKDRVEADLVCQKLNEVV